MMAIWDWNLGCEIQQHHEIPSPRASEKRGSVFLAVRA